MPPERESNEIKKSMAYDLLIILDEKQPHQETYTVEEIKTLIKKYIATATTN